MDQQNPFKWRHFQAEIILLIRPAATITKEFCSRMGKSPTGKDVLALLQDKDLLHSICVEGWIASTQIIHIMDMVEELERKASSHYLRGKLLLNRLNQVKDVLHCLERDLDPPEYQVLCDLIELLKDACVIIG